MNKEQYSTIPSPSDLPSDQPTSSQHRPILFLDIDGVLNTTKHAPQIHFESIFLSRLKRILQTTNARVVLTTFWRHFHEYITYVLHRHGIDADCVLPLPYGVTRGKQSTKNFLRHYSSRQGSELEINDYNEGVNSMIGRSAEDEGEYSSRAEEIEAWLRMYGEKFLGKGDSINQGDGQSVCDGDATFDFHPITWKYVILDDRPSAAKPDTPLFDRFVLTQTKCGLTDEDAEKAIDLLLHGPNNCSHKQLTK
ncbi:hypothetical protein ACHAWO_000658 [Cyclotella atomus]|uniref:FCP1 homology domain-containing protein n=1 Tax=Cyclotella atomus TaxID=382360 RepID=A0ABD3QA12_9STRA